jgi:uncharacterized phage protein gp47/JayE
MPIEYPDLELRNEDQLVAEAIARTSGELTADVVRAQIREREEILKLIAAGLPSPICPELTNANPSAPHTVLLEAMGWLLAQQAYRINRVPNQNLIAFANLFGIERRAAMAAQTTLRFTVDAPLGTDVTIPEGTQVADATGTYIFETAEEITILYGTLYGDVFANRTVTGHTLLAPGIITELIDPLAYVTSVSNLSGIDSGLEPETIDSVLSRVKTYQRRGERIVTAKDLEEAVLEDALEGNGIVRAFPFIANGQFTDQTRRLGHTTVVAMTRNGDALDADTKGTIYDLLPQVVGSQFVYVVDPLFVDFYVSAKVKLSTANQQSAIEAAIQQNLQKFYAPSREQFGRPILRSEIIAIIEGTPGVDRIVSDLNAPIIAQPTGDLRLRAWELPRLLAVSLTVV